MVLSQECWQDFSIHPMAYRCWIKERMGRTYIPLGTKHSFSPRHLTTSASDGTHTWAHCRLAELLGVACISIPRTSAILWRNIMIEGRWARGVRGLQEKKRRKKTKKRSASGTSSVHKVKDTHYGLQKSWTNDQTPLELNVSIVSWRHLASLHCTSLQFTC